MVKPLEMIAEGVDLSGGDRREVGLWQVIHPAQEIDRHRIQASPRVATRFGSARGTASVVDVRCGDRHGNSFTEEMMEAIIERCAGLDRRRPVC
jgi:hypothetical protein